MQVFASYILKTRMEKCDETGIFIISARLRLIYAQQIRIFTENQSFQHN